MCVKFEVDRTYGSGSKRGCKLQYVLPIADGAFGTIRSVT